MNGTSLSRFVAAALFAGATFGLASAAQARPDVQVSIGLPGLPGLPPLPGLPFFVQSRPAPVYVQPEPVYVQPRPVYAEPEVVYQRPWRPSYRYEYEYERERPWRHGDWQRREWQHRHHDGDRYGPPNRHGRD